MTGSLILREGLVAQARDRLWKPFREGVEVSWLYRNGVAGPAAAYLRYAPGATVPFHRHAGYEHVLVLSGSQTDHNGRHTADTLVINPPGSAHAIFSEEGCIVLVIWERAVIFEPEASVKA
jgi:anti-sigma factor ChrR (cupin superfamily)